MIRYRIDVMTELKNRGFSSYELRKGKHLSESAMTKIRNNLIVGSDILNTLCILLQCQPGDLLEYVPDEQDPVGKDGEK